MIKIQRNETRYGWNLQIPIINAKHLTEPDKLKHRSVSTKIDFASRRPLVGRTRRLKYAITNINTRESQGWIC